MDFAAVRMSSMPAGRPVMPSWWRSCAGSAAIRKNRASMTRQPMPVSSDAGISSETVSFMASGTCSQTTPRAVAYYAQRPYPHSPDMRTYFRGDENGYFGLVSFCAEISVGRTGIWLTGEVAGNAVASTEPSTQISTS